MANHLRITAPGWETYTGDFGGVAFTDGLSDDVVSRRQIDHLSALVRCDLSDENGNLVGQGGIAARLVGGVNIGDAPSALRKATQDEIDADLRQRRAEAGKAPTKIYTKEELEALAAAEGLIGLRKVGDAWSVRDRAIGKLITLILNAQRVFVASKTARDTLVAEGRAAAAKDALDRNLAREAEIDAKARLVVQGGTSNAIGPDGENVTIALPPVVTPVEAATASPTVADAPITTTATVTLTLEQIEADLASGMASFTETATEQASAKVAQGE